MQNLKFWQVDAFTAKPFKGNPAAVFILDEPLEDKLMLNIAKEMNLSETAFLVIKPDSNPYLRWFTPMFEIDLCGHATLATAHVYFSEYFSSLNEITFDTKYAGPLKVVKNDDYMTMDFPSRPGKVIRFNDVPNFVYKALSNINPIFVKQSRDLMLVYENEETILNMAPDFNALMKYDGFIIVTAKTKNTEFDFISRFFCASDGIQEDPVTGSAHSTLAPYWSEQLGKLAMSAYQASERGGVLYLKMNDDRVEISGNAVTIFEGEMVI